MKITKQIFAVLILMIFVACSNTVLDDDIAETQKPNYELQYEDQYFDRWLRSYTNAKVAFVVIAEHANHHFSEGDMPLETVYEFVEEFEAGVRFMKEWFETDYSKPLQLLYYRHDSVKQFGIEGLICGGGSGEGKAWVSQDYSAELSPSEVASVMGHEAVHALCYLIPVKTNFPIAESSHALYFEEGLATMLEFLYGYEKGTLQDVYLYNFSEAGIMSAEGALEDAGDVETALNDLALRRSFKENDFSDASTYGEQYSVLQSYYTSASFHYYLLGKAAKEDFLRAYSDISLMEEVYGKDLDGLIEEWLDYLERDNP